MEKALESAGAGRVIGSGFHTPTPESHLRRETISFNSLPTISQFPLLREARNTALSDTSPRTFPSLK